MDLNALLRITSAIAAAGIVVNALEILTDWREIKAFFAWSILRTKYPATVREPRWGAIMDALVGGDRLPALLVLQIGAAICVPLAFEVRPLALACSIITLAVHLLIHFRLVYGMDGSDQMHTVVWAGIAVFLLADSDLGRSVAAYFIAGQALLSYLTSGVAKAISPFWRSGRAVGAIVSTESYGSSGVATLVRRLHLSFALSWGTIVFEVAGPFTVLLGVQATLVFVTVGALFHLGIAATMGLNSFVWPFIATYPSVLYVAGSLAPLTGARSR